MSGRRRGGIDVARLEQLLDRMAALRVVVVGDVLLDEYVWGATERISPEAPVPVVRVDRESSALGGAGNVARNVVALGARCALCGVVGDDPAGRHLRELATRDGIDAEGLVDAPERATVTKTRVVARGRQILRIDREPDAPLARAPGARLLDALYEAAGGVDGAIVADYAKGTLPGRIVRSMMKRLTAQAVPVALDPKHDLTGYRGATLVKPNRLEAQRLAGAREGVDLEPTALLARLRRRLPGADWAITDGSHGMTIAPSDGAPIHVPTVPRDIFDVQGAGDTTIAALCLTRLAGGSLLEAAVVAHAAAGVVVGKIGTASAPRDEVRQRLPEVVDALREIR